MRRTFWTTVTLLSLIPSLALAWPNGPNDDPQADPPNDSGYQGQWNLWSFVPTEWQPNLSADEVALGTGIHADRAWQITPGDRRVIVAVHDSGVYWDNKDLVNKYYLHRGELANCKPTPLAEPPAGADDFDVDGSGWFDIRDYYAAAGNEADELANWDENGNGMLDPQDLIQKCSDGVDDDNNGYKDDISGWDFFKDDNDAYDDTRFGHGNGEARDSVSEGNNGIGDIGVCPDCTALMIRVGDSFVTDSNKFAQGVIYSTDNGASVIQSALGAVNNTKFAIQAIDYAYNHNVAFVASAADELSYHHNFPGSGDHSIYVHAIQYDRSTTDQATTFLNYNNCTNHGMQLLLSTPGTGCSSEAVGITSGLVGLMYSAAIQTNGGAGLNPPITAEEIKQVLVATVDDIAINPNDDDPEKFESGPGWDFHFGYGRPNARAAVDAIVGDRIPPEVDIIEPLWFQVLDPGVTPSIEIHARVNKRIDGKTARYDSVDWKLEYAMGKAPNEGWIEIASGSTSAADGGGVSGKLADWDLTTIDADLAAKILDPHQNAVTLRLSATGTNPAGDMVTGKHRKGFLLNRDADLVEGFPKYLGTSLESSPIFANLDGDDDEELVLFASDGLIHVWQQDGTELEGFPVSLAPRRAMEPTNDDNVRNGCAYRADKAGCLFDDEQIDPDVAKQTGMMPIAIGDLEDDGNLEIVATTWDGFVWVIEHDGSVRDGFPVTLDLEKSAFTDRDHIVEPGFFASPVLYDLDGDGTKEIVAAAMDQHIYVWHPDGTPMAPYPVRLVDQSSPESVGKSDRIVSTPAIGDIDGDGKPEIASGTSEIYGAAGFANEAVCYVLDAETGEVADGWPRSMFGLTVDVLPTVGRGVVANPMLADLDFDGTLEISFDTISTQGWIFEHDGELYKRMNNQVFGEGSDSEDAPAYILMNNGAFANIDNEGGIDMVKGTAGFDFAIAFAGGGVRGDFDHHMSGWDTDTGMMMEGFPRVHDDWQFFNAPTVVDIDNDANPEVIIGSGGYLVHAWNYLGEEPPGWPKQTGGWIIASAAVGEFDGDGKFEVAVTTRDGWLYVWNTGGDVQNVFEWSGFGANPHNTNNYEDDPTPYQPWEDRGNNVVEEEPDTTGGDDTAEGDTSDETDTGSTGGSKKDGCAGGTSRSGAWWLMAAAALLITRRRRESTQAA